MTELEKMKVLSALRSGYNRMTKQNTSVQKMQNAEEAIEIIETTEPVNIDVGSVSQQRELLKAFAEWLDEGYKMANTSELLVRDFLDSRNSG